MKAIHKFTGVLAVLCLMTVLFFTSVEAVVYWTPGYFEKEYAKYQVLDDLPSMTMEDLLHVTNEMMDYLKGKREDLHVETTMGGETREFFNQREISHMEDVQGLFLKAMSLRRACLILCIALVVLLLATKAPLLRLLPFSVFTGTGLFFALIAVLGAIISTDFTKYFIMFHHMFFTNDLWMLDPNTDMLINIVPEGFFMDTVFRIILTFCTLCLLLLAVSLFLFIRNKKNRKMGD
jgi:integral membrane protein (TIGR01906 family)